MVASTSFHQLLYRLLRPRLEPENSSVRGRMKQSLTRQTIGFQALKAVLTGEEPGQNPRRQSGGESDRAPPAEERGRWTFDGGATESAARVVFWLISA